MGSYAALIEGDLIRPGDADACVQLNSRRIFPSVLQDDGLATRMF